MAKFNKHHGDGERFVKCEICMELIPIEYNFSKGDEIACYECGTEYLITSNFPVKLSMLDIRNDPDDFFGEMIFDE
jgi:hypothetical protein